MKKILSLVWTYLKKSDTLLLVLCVISTVYGVILIKSSTNYLSSSRAVYVQLLGMFFGIFLYFLFSLIDVDILADNWKLLYAAGLIMLGLLYFAEAEGGNKAWLRFGGIGIQPSEIVKIIFIIIHGHLITHFTEERRLNHVLSIIAMGVIFMSYFGMIVFLSSDLGSALVYLFIFVVMLFAGGLKIHWFLIGLAGVAVAAPYIWNNVLSERHRNRIIAPYAPEIADPTGLDITWQVNQSKAAIASGRVFGSGLFKGAMTQSGSVPRQRTDFIFSAAGEELGIVGCLIIIALLVAIIVRCIQIGLRSQSRLGALVCVGIAAMLMFQTFENIGMCIGIAPVIGLTLPFFSSGGSSIVTSFAAMGIVSGIKMKPKPTMFLRY